MACKSILIFLSLAVILCNCNPYKSTMLKKIGLKEDKSSKPVLLPIKGNDIKKSWCVGKALYQITPSPLMLLFSRRIFHTQFFTNASKNSECMTARTSFSNTKSSIIKYIKIPTRPAKLNSKCVRGGCTTQPSSASCNFFWKHKNSPMIKSLY